MGWVRPIFRHRKYKSSRWLLENFSLCPIFYRWIAVGAPGDASVGRLGLLTDEGMVTAF